MIIKLLREAKDFLGQMYNKKTVMLALVKRDLKAMHAGSYLGVVWIYLQPILYLLILYFVFTIGLKTGYMNNHIPFILYMSASITSWFYFADCFGSSPNVIRKHSYLIKKLDFRLSILPGVNLFVNAVPHFVLMALVVLLCWVQGYPPTWYVLQLFYYFFAMMMLLFGLSWITSATNLFVPDVTNIVGLILQFGFWLTPIVWDVSRIPVRYLWIFKLNPMFYIADGYRNSLIYHIPFWIYRRDALIFWTITGLICLCGAVTFRKLRPHFAEVV